MASFPHFLKNSAISPGLQGAEFAQDLLQKETTNKYLPEQLKAAIMQLQLENQKSQTLMPFLAPGAQADINQKRSSTELNKMNSIRQAIINKFLPEREYNADLKETLENIRTQKEMPYWEENAQTASEKAKSDSIKAQQDAIRQEILNRFLPYRERNQISKIDGGGNASTDAINQYLRAKYDPQFQSMVSTNPEFAKTNAAIISGIQQGALNQQLGISGGQQGGFSIPDILPPGTTLPGTGYRIPEFQNQQQAPTQAPGQVPTKGQPPITVDDILRSRGITPEDISSSQSAVGGRLEKQQTTAAILNQRMYALEADRNIEKASQLLPAVKHYTGIIGATKHVGDSMLSAFGHASQEYKDYGKFVKSMTMASADIKRKLGGSATDQEQERMDKLTRPDGWNVSPDQVQENYDWLMELNRKVIDPTLAMGNKEVREELASGGSNKQSSKTVHIVDSQGNEGDVSRDEWEKKTRENPALLKKWRIVG
jgi:hypothetical protein